MGTIGQIRQMSCTFEWEIPFSHLQECGGSTTYFSPSFEFANGTWYLYIEFYDGNKCRWCIYLYLVRKKSPCSKHVISYELSIKDKDGLDFKTFEELDHEFVGYENKSPCLYERVHRLCKETLAPKGFLTFSCTVSWERCFDEAAVQTASRSDSEVAQQRIGALKVAKQTADSSGDAGCRKSKILWETLSHNLKDLFLNQRNCDVTIKVQGQPFQAHQIILEARSTVFAKMFEQYDMAEGPNVVVYIEDTQPDVFRGILLYMYSGKVELSTENVFEFYILSENYKLDDLKQECVKFIELSLSVETFCDVAVLVGKYNHRQMKEFLIAFLKNNMSDVLATVKWKKFEAENLSLAFDVLKATVLEKDLCPVGSNVDHNRNILQKNI